MSCQKETAEIIVKQKAYYIFPVKDNHPNLKKDIEDFIQDETMQNTMQSISKTKKDHRRIERD